MPDLTRDLEATQGGRYRCPFCDARRGLSFDEDVGDSGACGELDTSHSDLCKNCLRND